MPKDLPRIETANALSPSDFLAKFLPSTSLPIPFQPTPEAKPYSISLVQSADLEKTDLSTCFSLIEATSSEAYAASSLGWHPVKKRREMRLPDLRYLLVKEMPSAAPEAFCSFMLTYEDGNEVVYCYEVHISQHLQGKGLGKRLMQIMEDVGRRAGMEKVMLTVFMANEGARRFYTGIGYVVDEYSPGERILRNGVVKEPDLQILSKPLG